MDDRELLELAAKAAGVPARVVGAAPGSYSLRPDSDGVARFCCMAQWNPLTSDGDCARLEAVCEIDVTWFPGYVDARKWSVGGLPSVGIEQYANYGGDKQAARRRASTRAAAEIGKSMTQKTGE